MAGGSRMMRLCSALGGAALLFAVGARPASAEDAKAQQGTADQQPEKHHSKAKGALVQHHKNKKAEKKAAKQEKQQQ